MSKHKYRNYISYGLMTDKDARKASLGGEVLAYIW